MNFKAVLLNLWTLLLLILPSDNKESLNLWRQAIWYFVTFTRELMFHWCLFVIVNTLYTYGYIANVCKLSLLLGPGDPFCKVKLITQLDLEFRTISHRTNYIKRWKISYLNTKAHVSHLEDKYVWSCYGSSKLLWCWPVCCNIVSIWNYQWFWLTKYFIWHQTDQSYCWMQSLILHDCIYSNQYILSVFVNFTVSFW